MIMSELTQNKQLIKLGEGDSSAGSDSAPSEDNLAASELLKNLPVADKTLKLKIKAQDKEKNDLKKAQPPLQKQNSISKKEVQKRV